MRTFTIPVLSKSCNHFRCYLKAGDTGRKSEKLLTFDPGCRYEMPTEKREREREREGKDKRKQEKRRE